MKENRRESRKRAFRRRLQYAAARKAPQKREIRSIKEEEKQMDIRFAVAAADFAVNLLKECGIQEDNVLLSPVSVETALLMAANGAKSQALEEYRKLFGGEMSFEELQNTASQYVLNMPSSEKAKFHLANSVWIEQSLAVKEDFITKNRELYGAEVCQIPFNQDAVTAMNVWVEKHTDGMIDRVIEEVDPANMLYLLNALSFDGEWERIYKSSEVRPAEFTCENGKTGEITGLFSTEDFYIENDLCTGFVKPYADGKYSFTAFLPNEGLKISDFLKKLDGKTLLLMPASARKQEADVMIPKFSVSYSSMLSALLMKLGLQTAMGHGGDYSGISDAGVGIDEVIHKTTLTLDERGTKAGAVTAVMMKSAMLPIARPEVILDRPFIYEIIDNSTLLPVFVGICMKPEA